MWCMKTAQQRSWCLTSTWAAGGRTATSPAWRASRAGWSAASGTAASARWAGSGTEWNIWSVWCAGVLDPAWSSPRGSQQRGGHLHQRHAGGGDQPARHHGLGPHHRQHAVPQLPANVTDFWQSSPPCLQVWDVAADRARLSDRGHYECQVNTEPKINLGFWLNVLRKFSQAQWSANDYSRLTQWK